MHVVRITKIRIHGFDKSYEGIYIGEFRSWEAKKKIMQLNYNLKIEIIF